MNPMRLPVCWRRSIVASALVAALLTVLVGCAALPTLDGRSESSAATDTVGTRLGRAIAPRATQHPGLSGIRALTDSHEAFAARLLLAQSAERTLDVQYYIWKDDASGRMLFAALHAAAERGVRVRLLLDDNGTAGLDETLATLDADPRIEVRLFNPFVIRGSRVLGYLSDFSRLNRRMHNKSFTADSQATIVGGRNIGDAYFGAGDGILFVDLDVLVVGPAVHDVSRDFDRYWASRSAYPLDRIVAGVAPDRRAQLLARLHDAAIEPASAAYVAAVHDTPLAQQLTDGQLELEWASTRMVSDDPAKALGLLAPDSAGLLQSKLALAIGEPASELQLVSAYFVPAAKGTEVLGALARRGVKVSILTNSLEATDVAPVHAGYARRREALLDAGVALWELRRMAPGPRANAGIAGITGSSASSLHAKTFAVDRSRVFVGSFNFDPRSLALNTELGFVIDSPALAGKVAANFEQRIPQLAYEVRRAEDGSLVWLERRGADVLRHQAEPGAGF